MPLSIMLSGKAISRALRGHFRLESALTTKLLRLPQSLRKQDATCRNLQNNEERSTVEEEAENSVPDDAIGFEESLRSIEETELSPNEATPTVQAIRYHAMRVQLQVC